MTSNCFSGEDLIWMENIFAQPIAEAGQISSDREEGDAFRAHLEDSTCNRECDLSFLDMPSEDDSKILESHLQIAQAMTSSGRPPYQPLSFISQTPLLCPHIFLRPVIDGQVGDPLRHQCIDHLQSSGLIGPCKEDCTPGDTFCSFTGVGKSPVKLPKSGLKMRKKRRVRSKDWSAEEKCAYLTLKEEALGTVKGKDWDFISQNLQKRYGYERSSKCCEDLWGTFRKAFKAIRDHELLGNNPQRSNWVSFWEMDGDGRVRHKLPRIFPKEWCNMMERILAAQEHRSGKSKSPTEILAEGSPGDHLGDDQYHIIHPAKPLVDGSQNLEYQLERRLDLPHSNLPAKQRSKVVMEEDLQIKQQVGAVVDSAFQQLGNTESSSGTGEENALITLVSMLVKRQVEDAVKSALEPLVAVDQQLTNFAPNLFKKWMMDALDSSLVPVSSALRAVQNQEKLEDQARLRAIEEERRVLDLEEKQIKRRRVGRHQRPGRLSSKQQGLRIKS
ncbi:hypothetical protein M758_6G060700 [Ceratodon purpureus]|nr:hypothetical protein M758_6G060700 [Ceratodon purpureus]